MRAWKKQRKRRLPLEKDIMKIFWTNVDKYRRKRYLTWEDLIKVVTREDASEERRMSL